MSRKALLPEDAPYDLGKSKKGASFKKAAPGDKPGPALMYSPIPYIDTCLKEDTPSQRLTAAWGPHHQTLIGNVSVLMLLAQSQRSLVICLWESSIGMFFFTIGSCEGMSHTIVRRSWDRFVFLGVWPRISNLRARERQLVLFLQHVIQTGLKKRCRF